MEAPSGYDSMGSTRQSSSRRASAHGAQACSAEASSGRTRLLVNLPFHEGQPGTVFQVKGDSTAMHHVHTEDVNIVSSSSYKDSYIMAQPTEQQAAKIRYWATHETPPSAPNQAAVQENCQGWVIRVINRLVAEGIVQQQWQNFAMSIKQSIK